MKLVIISYVQIHVRFMVQAQPIVQKDFLTSKFNKYDSVNYSLTSYTRGKIYFVSEESKIRRGSVAASAAFCSLVNQQAIRLKYSRPEPWRELCRYSVLYSPRITKLLCTSKP
jgi:hypothetical protein